MLVMIPFIVFAGFIINFDDVPVWLNWFQYLSPMRYSTEAMVYTEFEDNDDYINGEEVVERFNYNVGQYQSIAILLGIAIFLRIAALIFLKLTVKKVQ